MELSHFISISIYIHSDPFCTLFAVETPVNHRFVPWFKHSCSTTNCGKESAPKISGGHAMARWALALLRGRRGFQRWSMAKMDTLWWTNILPWKIAIFNGKIHYFYGHFQWQCSFTRGYDWNLLRMFFVDHCWPLASLGKKIMCPKRLLGNQVVWIQKQFFVVLKLLFRLVAKMWGCGSAKGWCSRDHQDQWPGGRFSRRTDGWWISRLLSKSQTRQGGGMPKRIQEEVWFCSCNAQTSPAASCSSEVWGLAVWLDHSWSWGGQHKLT